MIRIALKIFFRFKPTEITDASSVPSGLSWNILKFIAGKFRIELSSEIVPLSERTHLELICREQ